MHRLAGASTTGAAGSHELTHQAQIINPLRNAEKIISYNPAPGVRITSQGLQISSTRPGAVFKLPSACGPGRPAKGEKRGGSSSPRSSSKGKDSQPPSEPTNRLLV